MKLVELYTELSIDPFKLIESIVHAEGSAVILFKNRKSEILYVNEQFSFTSAISSIQNGILCF